MAESFLGSVFEFLIGLFVVGFIVNFISFFFLTLIVFPALGLSTVAGAYTALFYGQLAIRALVLLVLYMYNKGVAFGYTIDVILGFLIAIEVLSFF